MRIRMQGATGAGHLWDVRFMQLTFPCAELGRRGNSNSRYPSLQVR